MSYSNVNGSGLAGAAATVSRFIPEPQSRVANLFSGVMRAVAGTVVPGASGINPEYQDLISKQIEVQEQMQLVSLVSNVEKSKHETQMAAVRNLRAG